MNFLNLSFGEFLALAGIISAGIVALYLLDRTKRRQVVATLRFWTAGKMPEELQHKRRIHQPWSMLLQFISILLLLLAIAAPRIGDLGAAHDHVLLLDTSAWMGARARQGILLDQAKTAALAYVRSLPSLDRVMMVRADALATPVTQFDSDKNAVADAIRRSRPSTSALNLEQALEFAQQAQRLQSQKAGEIVFVGAGRIAKQDTELAAPPNLRVISIPSNGENVGLRKLSVRRATSPAAGTPASPDTWEAFVELRNDGSLPREITLLLQFAGTAAGSKTMTLAAGSTTQATFLFHAKAAGFLEARVTSTNGRGDAFPQDDAAIIQVPVGKILRVAVYSPEPDLLKPLLTGNVQVQATFDLLAKYDPQAAADIVVFDRFAPRDAPANVASVWIEPPAGSPFAMRSPATKTKLDRWHQDTALGAGLYTKDVELASTEVFNLAPGDQAVAETAQGPVVVQRQGAVKMAALGFDPLRSTMKYDLATPLLIANLLRWMAPEVFRSSDVQAGTVGTVNVTLDKGVNAANVKVLGDDQRPLPFTIEGNRLQFFAGAAGNVRVITGDRETVYSLTLPDVGDVIWRPPADVARGVRRGLVESSSAPNPWPWLALAGGLGLLADWLLYGRKQIVRLKPRAASLSLAERLRRRKAS
jgi:von Willebrand factor type A domain/Aerotolerance regulator N-terminal